MDFLAKVFLAYLLGSVIGALWIGRFMGRVDIRQLGSGNAGGTNALRTQGWLFALMVVIVDVGKGALAAGWLPFVAIPGLAAAPIVGTQWLQVACAAAAIMGHVFPIYHRFKGGKGAATLVGTLIFLSWQALLIVVLSWVFLVAVSGYVGLATMLAVFSATVYVGVFTPTSVPLLAFMVFISVFIAFTHRSNIARMRAGEEHRMRKLMLFKGHAGSSNDD